MRIYTRLMAVIFCILVTSNAPAWVATGGHGVYYHDGATGAHYGSYYHHGGYYYNEGWAAHGVVVGVPAGVYNGYGCGYVQTCGAAGCVTKRVCN
jgi:hypothetical protein